MLASPSRRHDHPTGALHDALVAMMGDGRTERVIERGLIEHRHHNPELTWALDTRWTRMDDLDAACLPLGSYGVGDSPEQIMGRYRDILERAPEPICISVVHVLKNPAEPGAGWRWRKWGEYIGEGTPTVEYLNDEPGFADGVWVYSVFFVAEVA